MVDALVISRRFASAYREDTEAPKIVLYPADQINLTIDRVLADGEYTVPMFLPFSLSL